MKPATRGGLWKHLLDADLNRRYWRCMAERYKARDQWGRILLAVTSSGGTDLPHACCKRQGRCERTDQVVHMCDSIFRRYAEATYKRAPNRAIASRRPASRS